MKTLDMTKFHTGGGGWLSQDITLERLSSKHFARHFDIYTTLFKSFFIKNDFSIFKKVNGFTLAEVLITLGIIGIVAAMTLPQLIKNYKHHVLQSQFKKAYSVAQQVVLMAKADSGVSHFAKYCADIADGYYDDPDNVAPYPNSSQCQTLLNNAFTRSQTTGTWEKDKYTVNRNAEDLRTYNNSSPITLSGASGEYWTMRRGRNGMLMQFRINMGNLWITVDTNGIPKPNLYGHDIFVFYVDKKKDAITGLKQNKSYTQDELDKLEGEEWIKDKAGNPCSANSNQKSNGMGCSWYAINDINPDTNQKGYWRNLPK